MSLEYSAVTTAYEEAGRRLKDEALQTRIGHYLGNIWPQGFEKSSVPQAVFAPYLAKGSVVECDFLRIAGDAGFNPVVATYQSTEFVTANAGLVDCYRPPLALPKAQRTRDWVVPAENWSGILAPKATKYTGTNITEYWLAIRAAVLDDLPALKPSKIVDFSAWYSLQAKRFGWDGGRSKAPYYYRALIGLYASGRAVLFDTPPTAFADRVMKPAVQLAESCIGVTPLITEVLQPQKRDWVDLSFLRSDEVDQLQLTGKIR